MVEATTAEPPVRAGVRVRSGEARKGKASFLGGFVVPPEGENATFQDHQALVTEAGSKFGFNPKKFAFDAALADRYTNSAERGLVVIQAKNYQKHAPLRDNIATLRNVLMGIYFDEPLSPKEEQARAKVLQHMADKLGKALRNNKIKGASNRDIGAAELYRYLDTHREPGLFDRPPIIGWIVSKLGNEKLKRRFGVEWDLPPIELTPFRSSAADAAHLHGGRDRESIITLLKADAQVLHHQSEGLDEIRNLPEPTRENAIDEARRILEALRMFYQRQDQTAKDRVEPDAHLEESNMLLGLMEAYRQTLAQAAQANPAILLDDSMQRAKTAFASLANLLDSDQSLMRSNSRHQDFDGRQASIDAIAAAIAHAGNQLGKGTSAQQMAAMQHAAAITGSGSQKLVSAKIAAASRNAATEAEKFNTADRKEAEPASPVVQRVV